MDYHAGFLELSKTLQEIAGNLGRGRFPGDERGDVLRATASGALKKQGWVYYDTEGWRHTGVKVAMPLLRVKVVTGRSDEEERRGRSDEEERRGYIEGKLPTDLDLPPAYRTQANLWQAKYFEARCALVGANKGLRRLRNRLDRVRGQGKVEEKGAEDPKTILELNCNDDGDPYCPECAATIGTVTPVDALDLDRAVATAIREPNLLKALTWICVWAIRQARFNYGSGTDGGVEVCIKRVMSAYPKGVGFPPQGRS